MKKDIDVISHKLDDKNLILAIKKLIEENIESVQQSSLLKSIKEHITEFYDKEKIASDLINTIKELIFEKEEKEKRASELFIANEKLVFDINEKEKRAAELIIANKKLLFDNTEKEKRAAELVIANKKLLFDNTEKEKRAAELIIAKERAEESERLKTAFLANMSHEIRTPMNGILGFADLLKKPNLTGEQQQDYINIIEQSGARMLNIINDIISISKVQSGQMKIFKSETDLNDQLKYIFTFFKSEAKLKQIELSYKLPNNKIIVNTDREKIYAILTNLVKNSIKFTNKGKIEFGYDLNSNNDILFYVMDTGIGVTDEQKEYIFERFRQGNETLSRNYEGAGLGLSISKAYVEMLGGEIWLESIIDEGTIFYFTIPYNNGVIGEKVIDSIININIDKDINNLKVLVAEDDHISEILIVESIEMFCKEILIVKNGIDAVEMCKNNTDIDIILMDIKMPKMNGYDATKEIRLFNKDVIIIAQTAFAFIGEREKALESGCNEYISKPINRNLLIDLIKKQYFLKMNK